MFESFEAVLHNLQIWKGLCVCWNLGFNFFLFEKFCWSRYIFILMWIHCIISIILICWRLFNQITWYRIFTTSDLFYDNNSTKQAAFVLSLLLDLCKQYNRLDKFLAWGWYGMGDNFYQTDNNKSQTDRDQWYGLIQK